MTKMTEEQKAQRKIEREAKAEQKRFEDNLQQSLERARNPFTPKNPTYFFEVGEEVRYGAITKTVIKEVLDDGMIYRIEKTSVAGPNERKRPTTIEEDYVSWIDIRKKEGRSETILSQKEEMFLNYMQQDISSILNKVYHFGVDMNPDYQRDHVWELSDKISLIDSIMNNSDIGKFLFNRRDYVDAETPLYEIIDGKQRVSAILEFIEDRFEYKGLKFSQMHLRDQHQIKGKVVNIAEVQNSTKEQLINLFIKVNTSGRIMSKDHLDKVRKMLK